MSETPFLSADRAVSIIREVAAKHHSDKILERVGNVRPEQVNHARTSFAAAMRDDETPLVFVDCSLLKNGNAGFLVTNRQVYSSFHPLPVPLRAIRDVQGHRPSLAAKLFDFLVSAALRVRPGGDITTLKINGELIYESELKLKLDMWSELLTRLGEASRAG